MIDLGGIVEIGALASADINSVPIIESNPVIVSVARCAHVFLSQSRLRAPVG